ncbi:hypothetical protein D3C76_1844740 [compost metagenome]
MNILSGKLSGSRVQQGTICALGYVIPDVFEVGVTEHPSESIEARKTATVEKKHRKETTHLVLA